MKIKILPTLLLILIPLFTSSQIKSLILFPILYAKQIRQDKIEKSKNEKRLKKEKQFIDSVWNAHEIKKQILKKKQDSIYKIKDSIQKIKFMEEQKLKKEKDSLLKIQLKKNEPNPKLYDTFRQSLYGMSKNRFFTLFRGIDYNFINFKFSFFLQEDYMNLTPTNDYIVKENYISQKYIPVVSSKNEYLKVKFNLIPHTDIIGYFASEYGDEEEKVYLVDSVEITGTTQLIIKLFTVYWNKKITIGGTKKGEIAHIQYLNDYVSLFRIDHNTCKITITKGNITANYNEIYGINPKKQ